MTRGRLLLAAPALAAAVTVAVVALAGDPAPTTAPQVLDVRVTDSHGPANVATGFAAAPERVVTVAHVLDGGGTVRVRGAGGRELRARVLRADRRLDLALLAVPGLAASRIRSSDADTGRVLVRRAARTQAVPAGVRRHIVFRLRDAAAGETRSRPALELDARLEIGDSGAPLVAPGGELLGAVFARSRRSQRRAYAVDARTVAAFLGRG